MYTNNNNSSTITFAIIVSLNFRIFASCLKQFHLLDLRTKYVWTEIKHDLKFLKFEGFSSYDYLTFLDEPQDWAIRMKRKH